jgi:hypothetical protein
MFLFRNDRVVSRSPKGAGDDFDETYIVLYWLVLTSHTTTAHQ